MVDDARNMPEIGSETKIPELEKVVFKLSRLGGDILPPWPSVIGSNERIALTNHQKVWIGHPTPQSPASRCAALIQFTFVDARSHHS
jgi:hypothetical protein